MNKFVKNNKNGWMYILPALIFISVFIIYPIFNTLILSFQSKSGAFSFSSYQFLFQDDKFIKAIMNTIMYALVVTPIVLIIALVISYALSQKIKLRDTFQTIFFLPYVTSTLAIGTVMAWIFHSNYGVLNGALGLIGLPQPQWLNDPEYTMFVIILFGIWKALAFNILILFTAIQSIDTNLEKAALVDGASPIRTFIKIKMPQIYPVIAYLLIINLIGSFKVYEEVVAFYGANAAGVDNSGMTMVYYVFQKLSLSNAPNIAAAASMILFVIILIATFFNKKLTTKFGGKI